MAKHSSKYRFITTERHTIWRGLAIYMLGASLFWRARFYDRAAKPYVTLSTKETLKREAILAAEEIAGDLALIFPPSATGAQLVFTPIGAG